MKTKTAIVVHSDDKNVCATVLKTGVLEYTLTRASVSVFKTKSEAVAAARCFVLGICVEKIAGGAK